MVRIRSVGVKVGFKIFRFDKIEGSANVSILLCIFLLMSIETNCETLSEDELPAGSSAGANLLKGMRGALGAACITVLGIGSTCVPPRGAVVLPDNTASSSTLNQPRKVSASGLYVPPHVGSSSALDTINPPTDIPTVTIEGKIYPVNIERLELKGDVIPLDIMNLKNLKILKINSVLSIPTNLPNYLGDLVELHANSATSIPDGFTNLQVLHANSATSIPDYLVKLRVLYANSATSISPMFRNLLRLHANSAVAIPGTYPKLKFLYANSARFISPNLTNLELLFADSLTSIPDTFVNLKKLHAESAFSIPATFVKLVWLYANSVKYIPSTLEELKEFYGKQLLSVPPSLHKLAILNANGLEYLPYGFNNLKVAFLGSFSSKSLPTTLTNLFIVRTDSVTYINVDYLPEQIDLLDRFFNGYANFYRGCVDLGIPLDFEEELKNELSGGTVPSGRFVSLKNLRKFLVSRIFINKEGFDKVRFK